MTKLSIVLPETGSKDTVAEPRVTTALKAIEEFINGNKLDTAGGNFKVEGIAEESLSSALKTKLGGSFVGLEYKSEAASFEAESGKFYEVVKAATVTLPAATAGRTIAVVNGTVGETVKVSAKAGKQILGDFFEGEVAELAPKYQHLLVEANGTNWWIVAGEPKRTQKYSATKTLTKVEAEAEVEPSATRPALVSLLFGTKETTSTIIVGGVTIWSATWSPISFFVPPGQKWKAFVALEAATILL